IGGGTGHTGLQGCASLVQTIVVASEQGASELIAMIGQAITGGAEQVHAKAHGAFSEAGLVVKHEGLAPLTAFNFSRTVERIGTLIEVIVTQIQAQLAVLDEISDSELAHAQGAGGYGYSHGSFFHLFLLQFG